jgi:hypothetical protein
MIRNNACLSRTAVWPIRLSATIFSLLAMLVLMCGTATAQLAGKGAVSGKVADPSGAAIPNATIVITKDATGVSVTTTSTSAGDYEVSTLDPGVYTVTVSVNGFEKLTQKNVQVNALETQTFNATLTVGASTETVTVNSAPPQLETTNATLGGTMEQELYSALPIEMGAYGNPDQRRATDFAFLMPGVQANNTTGNATTNTGIVNGSGSRGAVSAVYIDGLPFVRAGGNGDPRFVWTAISVDAVDQFQVQTSGYSAIYEGQGIQNYTVKAGGARYHGSVYEFFRNTSLDTWGFLGSVVNQATGKPTKPVEHSNEYGINLSGPLVPFGTWKDKLFAYGNYNGFRYASVNPTPMTFPTPNQQAGNFQNVISPLPTVVPTTAAQLATIATQGVFDPSTEATCASHNTNNAPCRYRYGLIYGGTPGANGGGVLGPAGLAGLDIIPNTQFSQVALNLQQFLPSGIGTAFQNNYIAPNRTGLTNWSTTNRIDYIINSKNTLTMVGAIGRQASSNPTGQTTAGRNVGPIPYSYGQTFAPKTAVGVIEETYTITPHIVNQVKYGYARYNGPTYDADQLPAYAATKLGLSGLPAGPASNAFPIVTFAGTNAPTGWAGTTPNVTLAENYTVLDNLQWVKGKHSFTFGGQTAWLLYNTITATGNSTPLTLANAVTETAGLNNAFSAISGTGDSYASFLIGQIDKPSYTAYLQQEFGARFRAISPYVQDNWKATSKLTLDIGVRYDFFPSVREVHNNFSFFNPNLLNPVTGVNGALQFTGNGPNTCNCSSPVNNYYKNIGPRLGLAYQLDPKTVVRASYGVMFTHGNAVGGSATTLGVLGFSAAPSFAPTGSLVSSAPLTGTNGAIPAPTASQVACGTASGPQYGTGFYTVAGPNVCGLAGTASFSGTPSGMAYADPYLGGRAPEYINYTLGFQHQWTDSFVSTITYVGSQGHFLPADGTNARGFYADQLDPKYLSLGTKLTDTNTALTADCANPALGITCPANFSTGQSLAAALKPFPFQTVSDSFGYVSNSVYNALQVSINMKASHGLTVMANYTWSRSIDDGGTFRSGYNIPAAFSQNGKSFVADRIERTVSTSNQPQHLVVTGVYALPIGKSILGGNAWERAAFGGFRFSEIFQAFSGSPLAITSSLCGTNPAETVFSSPAGACMPTYNPNFSLNGPAHINGKWGSGVVAGSLTAKTFIDSSAFIATPQYVFGNTPRTAPYNLTGPGNYQLDLALVRSVPLHLTEGSKLNFRAELYNATNKTFFAVASSVYGNAAFGTVTTSPNYARRAAQFSARVEF